MLNDYIQKQSTANKKENNQMNNDVFTLKTIDTF